MDFDAVDYFIKVTEAGSLANAMRQHRLPKSTLSHKIRQLEDQMGVALFVRDGHNMLLTDAGREFLDHAHRILASCGDAEAAVRALRQELHGTLTIGSSGEFGTTFTSELLFAFRQRYPQVKVDVIFLSPGYLFQTERQTAFDGIFWWGEPSQIDYLARKLTGASFGLFASPDYLARHPAPVRPDEMDGHHALAYRTATGIQNWHLSRQGETMDVLPPPTCTANDYWMLKYFAVAGEGIAYLPEFFTEIECSTGHLVPILPDWRSPEVAVNLLYPRRRFVSRKFTVFQEFCTDFYRKRASHYIPRYCVETVHIPKRPGPGGQPGNPAQEAPEHAETLVRNSP